MWHDALSLRGSLDKDGPLQVARGVHRSGFLSEEMVSCGNQCYKLLAWVLAMVFIPSNL